MKTLWPMWTHCKPMSRHCELMSRHCEPMSRQLETWLATTACSSSPQPAHTATCRYCWWESLALNGVHCASYYLHSLVSVSTFVPSESWIFDFQHCQGSVHTTALLQKLAEDKGLSESVPLSFCSLLCIEMENLELGQEVRAFCSTDRALVWDATSTLVKTGGAGTKNDAFDLKVITVQGTAQNQKTRWCK